MCERLSVMQSPGLAASKLQKNIKNSRLYLIYTGGRSSGGGELNLELFGDLKSMSSPRIHPPLQIWNFLQTTSELELLMQNFDTLDLTNLDPPHPPPSGIGTS